MLPLTMQYQIVKRKFDSLKGKIVRNVGRPLARGGFRREIKNVLNCGRSKGSGFRQKRQTIRFPFLFRTVHPKGEKNEKEKKTQ